MTRSRDRTRRGGFTVIELVIVMLIMLILAGIVVVGFNVIDFVDHEQKTKTALQGAQAVATEYAGLTEGYIVRIGEEGDPPAGAFFTEESFPGDNSIEQFVAAVRDVPECRELLFKLPSDLVDPDGDGTAETILDGWGRPMKYAAWITTDDATLPKYNSPFFASAGADGEWGDATTNNAEQAALEEDNMYSFEREER